MTLEFLEKLTELQLQGVPHVVVTHLETRGEAPSSPGAKAIVGMEGILAGTVGGGKIEARCIALALDLLREPNTTPPLIKVWNLQTDIGMTCGGEVKMLFETSRPKQWELAIFGAGHVAQSLIRLLVGLECRIHCFDTRIEWLNRLPQTPRLQSKSSSDLKSEVAALAHCQYFIVLTQGHATDVPVLEAIYRLPSRPAYIGAIGSAQKAQRIKRDLCERGIPMEILENLLCPVGLPLGTNAPNEIAISIAAQLLQVRDELSSTLARQSFLSGQ